MHRLKWFPLFFLIISCDFFLSTEERTDRLVDKELMAIDWNDVDQYPLFDECDETALKTIQLNCFQNQMLRRITTAFNDTVFTVEETIQDTMYVDFMIDEDGFVTIFDIEEKTDLDEVLPGFEREVSKRLNDLTTVAPAIKRGIPVSMRFRLPIVVDTEQ